MLERLVYCSASCATLSDLDIEQLLVVARHRNAASGVTGLLVGGSGWFLQVLEGEQARVEPIWQSIRRDPRHEQLVVVQRRALKQRDFADWSMQFRRETDDRFAALLEELTGGIRDPRLRRQILTFGETFLRGNEGGAKAAA